MKSLCFPGEKRSKVFYWEGYRCGYTMYEVSILSRQLHFFLNSVALKVIFDEDELA